jgi:hypothetical protein
MQIMNMGQYAHGNQPIQHMILPLQLCGQPSAVLEQREVMDRLYQTRRYCGDEDNGQNLLGMFFCDGFYPVCPATDNMFWEHHCLKSHFEFRKR